MSSSRCRQTQVPDAKHAHVGQLTCKVGVRYVSVEGALKDAGQLGFVGRIGVYPLRYRVCAFKRRACPSWRHSACGCRVCAAMTSPLKGSDSGSSSSPRSRSSFARASGAVVVGLWYGGYLLCEQLVLPQAVYFTAQALLPLSSQSPAYQKALRAPFALSSMVAILWGLAMIHLHRSSFEGKLSLRCVKTMHLPWLR